MGQLLHGSATTTYAIRAAIQRSQASISELSKRYRINPKTVAKWRNRENVADVAMGPKEVRSSVLSVEEEGAVVAFRTHTLLPLDDCLYALQASIPHLTRSSLHRCLQRHGISRLTDLEGAKPRIGAGETNDPVKRLSDGTFKQYPIGYFHIDIAEVRTEKGKLHMFVAIDRTSKFVFVELHERATRRVAREFLERLVDAVPYTIHTVLTDNGTQFTTPGNKALAAADIRAALANGEVLRAHAFEYGCAVANIDHQLTKPNHPWTNGQVERMNRTLKEATVRKYHYASHDQLREHLRSFVDAYNFAKRLKTLNGMTVYEFISMKWTKQPNRFRLQPDHLIPGPNI
ncbi:MAG: IS481 family transposase [Rhizobiaceae bacterium]